MNRFQQSQFAEWQNGHSYEVRIERILVPIDFSACTAETLRYAKGLAKEFNAVIQLLHVVKLNITGEERGIPRTGLLREMGEAARKALRKLVEVLWGGEIVAMITIREGRPDRVILREAHETRADLIVIGTHGHSGWLRLFRRNIVTRVVRRAPCPVLVVRVSKRDSIPSLAGRFRPRFEAESGVRIVKMNL